MRFLDIPELSKDFDFGASSNLSATVSDSVDSQLKTYPDDLGRFLLCLSTGLNPEVAEPLELCLSKSDSYKVNSGRISIKVFFWSSFPLRSFSGLPFSSQ